MKYEIAEYNLPVDGDRAHVLDGFNLESTVKMCSEYGIEFTVFNRASLKADPNALIFPTKQPLLAGDLILLRLMERMELGVTVEYGHSEVNPLIEPIYGFSRSRLLRELEKIDSDKFENIFCPFVENFLKNPKMVLVATLSEEGVVLTET
ncbi:MAG: hypothetical protein HY785_29410 [Oscillatoriophycideae cyanobacterium NC_groundwater_1537_Pr4_S-0.65um_50_18]|nr:hypothetical protein [Oscillatoriophycideae cyanobacterium NC_groundwater_1537_Pr4_S-0.65um_50_18]